MATGIFCGFIRQNSGKVIWTFIFKANFISLMHIHICFLHLCLAKSNSAILSCAFNRCILTQCVRELLTLNKYYIKYAMHQFTVATTYEGDEDANSQNNFSNNYSHWEHVASKTNKKGEVKEMCNHVTLVFLLLKIAPWNHVPPLQHFLIES